MVRTVKIGQSAAAPFCAFGDDSQYDGVLSYGFVIVKRMDVPRLLRRLLLVKEKFKIPAGVPIHCKVLMHGSEREKAGLAHLNASAARAVIGHVVHEIERVGCMVRYAVSAMPQPAQPMPSQVAGALPLNLPHEPKGILGVLAQACFAVAPDGSQGPLPADCEIVIAEDRTQVKFGSVKRSQAHYLASGFSDIAAAPGEVFRIEPRIATTTEEPLLQIADIVAYASSHSRSADPAHAFFTEQLNRISRRVWSEPEFNLGPLDWHAAIPSVVAP